MAELERLQNGRAEERGGDGIGRLLSAAPIGSRGAAEFGSLLGNPEFDEGLVGDIELASMIADGIQDILRHAQGDGFRRGAQLREGTQRGLPPIDVLGAVVSW